MWIYLTPAVVAVVMATAALVVSLRRKQPRPLGFDELQAYLDDEARERFERMPTNCPRCRARIVRDGDWWDCVGFSGPDEARRYLARFYPDGDVPDEAAHRDRPPCGWSATEASRVAGEWLG